ncbi:MAG: serine hydroxymethyltransferase [Rhizobiaceae bacterium]
MDLSANQLLSGSDPLIAKALTGEKQRQQDQIELIASENIVSRRVLEALGHEINNKTLEGYPGHRFHGGGQYVDIIEQAAIDRAKQLFGAKYVNVQPHSGTQANQAVFFALLKPGDRILSLDLAAGGHLSHGAGPNLSGRWFDSHHYLVDRDTGLMDYDAIAEQARRIKPQLLIAGGSAYPRKIDFARLSAIARSVGAYFLVDMAHVAGLVAAGAYPSPLPHADLVTCTTTKTLRGPRGGLILANSDRFAKKLQSAIFPGVQGSLHSNVLAAKAVCLGEALQPSFKTYGQQVVANGKTLAEILISHDIKVVSGGTDSHMVLLDLSPLELKGRDAEAVLAAANITCNKNPIPFDSPNPADWVGLRLGVAAATTRGFDQASTAKLGDTIAELVISRSRGSEQQNLAHHRQIVADICARHPV